jgi:uncharacterized membrane protein
MQSRLSFISVAIAFVSLGSHAAGQTAQPKAQIVDRVDDSVTVALKGNVHPLTARARASQPVDQDTAMEHMILYLKSDATQQAQLDTLVAEQHNPKSPLYHHFLTPQSYASQFGAADSDIAKVTAWLTSHGFKVESVPAGNRAIVFSGTAAQVENAFKTEIRQYTVAGANHIANASDPQIPEALAAAVGGIVKLHDFRHSASLTHTKPLTPAEVANPQYTINGGHYLAPSDYGIIYDINPLYTAGINGAGESIAVLARSNIYLSDVQSFRSFSSLAANNPQIVITNSNPGVLNGDSVETTLDTEWSGAVAPGASIKVIVSESTSSTDGIDLSALYAVTNNVAPIISLSYGSCEAFMGSTELAFYNSLWQQAAAQGQSVMVSAGDSGAAGCDGGSDSTGYYGKGINGLCSSPYSTCVGGTEFVDTTNPGAYWLPGNNGANGSAISYIPEEVWNESGSNGGSDLWAGGGGVSTVYPKPSWQSGPGVPADGKRDVPDISLSASGHDGYLIWLDGSLNAVGGTSAAAPSFAGLIALADQKEGARQGNVNTILYPLAALQSTSGAAVFHDIKTGNNTVTGVTGFSAATGYDLASGIGTVDANVLVNHWTDSSAGASLTLSASSTSLNVIEGQSTQTTITSTAGSSLNAAVSLSVSGAPTGVTATLASTTIASPGSGSVVLTVAATTSATPGTYTLTVTGTGGGRTATQTVSVVIPTPTFTFSASATSVSAISGGTAQLTLSTSPSNGFNSNVALSVSGLPAGVTGAFSSATLTGTAAGISTLTLTAAQSAHAGTYPLTVTATGGGVTRTVSVTLVINATPVCTLVAVPANISIAAGQGSSVQISCGVVTGSFSGALTLSLSGTAPTGVTARLASSTLTAGTSATALTVSTLSTTAAGSYSLTVAASGSGFSTTLAIPLIVSAAPTFALSTSAASVTALAGGTGQLSVSVSPQNAFTSAVSLSAAGLPAGVSAAFSSATVAGTGGSSNLTLTVGSTVRSGSYPFTITATGGGVTKSTTVTLIVPVAPSCTLSANPASITLDLGATSSASLSCGAVSGAFTGTMALSLSGVPSGVTAQLSNQNLPAGGTTTLSLHAASSAPTGSYSLVVHAAGSGFSGALTIPVVIPAPTFTLITSTPAVSALQGASAQMAVSAIPANGFSSAIGLSVSGLPAGVTAAFSAASFSTAGGTSTLTFTAATTAVARAYPITVSATGGGITKTSSVMLTVMALPVCTLASNPNSVSLTAGQTATAQISCALVQGTFSAPLRLTVSGAPSGVTAATASGTLTVGTATTLNISSTLSTVAGHYTSLTVTATGVNFSRVLTIPLTVTAPSTFSVTPAATSLTIKTGATGQVTATSLRVGSFNSSVAFSVTGLPKGVTASLSKSSLPAPGNGTVVATLSVASSATPGTYALKVTGSGGGITQSAPVTLVVAANPNFALQVTPSLTIAQGGSGSLVVSTGEFTGGFNSTIAIKFSGLGPGMNWATQGGTTANNMVNVTDKFTVAKTTPVGTYPVTITATGAGISHSTVAQVKVVK